MLKSNRIPSSIREIFNFTQLFMYLLYIIRLRLRRNFFNQPEKEAFCLLYPPFISASKIIPLYYFPSGG